MWRRSEALPAGRLADSLLRVIRLVAGSGEDLLVGVISAARKSTPLSKQSRKEQQPAVNNWLLRALSRVRGWRRVRSPTGRNTQHFCTAAEEPSGTFASVFTQSTLPFPPALTQP